MKKVFIAATKQNDGKTTVSLGLIANFKERFKNVGFIKPIGQRYLEEDGVKIDEDSLLIEEVCGIRCGLKDMSPVAVERGFTEKYLAHPDSRCITSQIKQAFFRVSKGQDLVIIEGTGHAGVGSVFDHSNAQVAKILGSKVIIISSGGIGRPIDEIVLNKALFEKEGVKVLGVIINKVLPQKYDKISQLVRKGLRRKGIKVLGILPYEPLLSCFSVWQILQETNYVLLCGRKAINNYVLRVIVGAMQPQDALRYIIDGSLIITPGDREDIIKAVLEYCGNNSENGRRISGIILTGDMVPGVELVGSLDSVGIPVLVAKEDTYTVASAIHDLTIKIRPQDTEKINRIISLVRDNVDFEVILRGM